MKVTFFTWDYANVSRGHNTWLCRFLPTLRQRGIDARVLCFQLSPRDEFPTARSLRRAGFSCTTVSEQEIKYTKQRVRWIFDRLSEDPPDVFVINAVYPAAYYAARWLREAGIPTVGMCHGMLSFYEGLLDQFVLTRTAYQVSALVCVSTWLQHDVLQRRPDGVLVRNIGRLRLA
jgi:colanic acid/amylovoran biosynthesis glycosyltransferase